MAEQPRKAPRCSICDSPQDAWPGGGGYGNNAWPVNNGRCCNACNSDWVTPARLMQFTSTDHEPR